MLVDYLEAVGFEVLSAKNGKQALEMVQTAKPDIMVLDVMMPGIDGIDVLRRLRSLSQLPVLMLTARASEQDKLMGFELGADDYLSKPFSMKELAARLRAILRRGGVAVTKAEDTSGKQKIILGDLVLDYERREVSREGGKLELTGAQFDILARMMEHPGRVFTRMQLLETLQDHPYEGYERTIDVHIKNIRKALEPNPSEPSYIHTVWGVGYKMAEPEE
ncbi:MAG TPA: response regulator transcription factor [Sediminispirochaeta sp.]|nr:response regulator transcription factor [Sediminispirochaeta sp.]